MTSGMKVPSYNEYNPDLGVPSGGPTINQPDIAGPIAGLTKEIGRMVIDYQKQTLLLNYKKIQ